MANPASAPPMMPIAQQTSKSLWAGMPALLVPGMSNMPSAAVQPLGSVIAGFSTKVLAG